MFDFLLILATSGQREGLSCVDMTASAIGASPLLQLALAALVAVLAPLTAITLERLLSARSAPSTTGWAAVRAARGAG